MNLLGWESGLLGKGPRPLLSPDLALTARARLLQRSHPCRALGLCKIQSGISHRPPDLPLPRGYPGSSRDGASGG